MTKGKIVWSISVLIFLLIICSFFVSAITAVIGNGRMTLRASPGETLEKYVLVKNPNNVSVNVNLTVTGELVQDIKLTEKSFVLQPGEDKNAQFSLYVRKNGTFQSKINVAFTPAEGKGAGAVLSSQITLISSGEDISDVPDTSPDDPSSSIWQTIGDYFGSTKDKIFSYPVISVLILTTLILVIALIFLLTRFKRKKLNSKRVSRARK